MPMLMNKIVLAVAASSMSCVSAETSAKSQLRNTTPGIAFYSYIQCYFGNEFQCRSLASYLNPYQGEAACALLKAGDTDFTDQCVDASCDVLEAGITDFTSKCLDASKLACGASNDDTSYYCGQTNVLTAYGAPDAIEGSYKAGGGACGLLAWSNGDASC